MKQNYTFKSRLKVALTLGIASMGVGAFGQLYEFDTHTFTNAGAEGQFGPTLAECVSEYTGAGEAWASNPLFLNMTDQGIQQWTVPATGDYTIEVGGAQGGNHLYTVDPEDGGLGAVMEGTFAFTEGDILYLLVGQQGVNSIATPSGSADNAAPGGGGGSFVWDPDDTSEPLIAAGGGAGGASPGGYADRNANATVDANNADGLANAGTDGNGGGINNTGGSYWAGAGAGWLTNGTGGNKAILYDYIPGGSGAQGGRSPLNGGAGGTRWIDGGDVAGGNEGGDGGFGGGGGGGSDNMGTGGGGGYSGGGGNNGSSASRAGGGGGSFNSGIDQVNVAAANEGMGYITITLLCNPLEIDVTDDGVCSGDPVTLTGTSVTGGTVTWDMGVDNGVTFIPPTGATVYTATSTSADDCPFQIEITSTDIPDIEANSSTLAACEGAEVTVFGTGGDEYTWTGTGDVDPIDGEPFPAEEGTTTYTVMGSLLGCEGPADMITLAAAPQPEVTASIEPSEICLGESATLMGEGDATTYNWGGGITDGASVSPATPGTYIYTVIGVSDVGCGDTATGTLIVNPIPNVNAGTNFAVCEDEEVILTGSGALTYTWTGGISDGAPFEVPAGETTYTVTGTNAVGCTDDDEITITGVERPVITAVEITDEFELFEGAIDITVSGGSGSYTFEWSNGAITEDISSLGEGTYTVVINDITAEKGLCPTEQSYTIQRFVGLEDNSLIELSAYPNPTNDNVVIAYSGAFNYEVVTVDGKTLMAGSAVDQEKISMESLANGTYIIKVTAGENTNFVQIVKQ